MARTLARPVITPATCSRCGRDFNAWTICLKGTPRTGGYTCQRCRAHATRGEKRPAAKLTDDAVQNIREARAAGAKIKDLAVKHKVNEATIYLACSRKSWKHVA